MNLAELVLFIDHLALVKHGVQGFRHSKQAHSYQHDLNTIQQLGNTGGITRLRRDLVEPNQTGRQANEQRSHAAQGTFTQHGAHGRKSQQHQHEVLGRPELDSQIRHHRCKQRDQHGGNSARHKRANGGSGQRRACTPAFRHLVALHGGHHTRRFTRCVEQNRSGGAPIHGPVVNAGKKDHGRCGFNLDGDRQQHGDCHRRANAGQHAHSGSQRTADKTPEQINRCGRSGKALHQLIKNIHYISGLT